MDNGMKSTSIKDTTKTERIQLIKQWEEEDGYEDGKKEIREINAEFHADYAVEE